MSMGSADGMQMSSSSGSMSMSVIFSDSHATPLFSNAWTPSSSAAYAGTCIFLIILAIVDRGLLAFKAVMERRWRALHLSRRHIATTDKNGESGCFESSPEPKATIMICDQGVEENARVVRTVDDSPIPWRLSVDIPRAGLSLVILGVSYLLMLAVMTQNIGYFCSVLAGAFLGELGLGRYIHLNEHVH
ncbi:hypothetical protein PENSTE_c019G04345 [Penicillium steckii]|uniref:Copper transport protein n=1 Tax=Penicillium steckii TaxID=303698 RepID=A0A1V6SVI4_9EURO|nr:hypothetical protein PENSTE_c019G04345 [Penicillium steckii]